MSADRTIAGWFFYGLCVLCILIVVSAARIAYDIWLIRTLCPDPCPCTHDSYSRDLP